MTIDGDHVARIEAQWRRELPDLQLDGMRIVGRARRITLLSRASIEAIFEAHGLDTGEFDVLATLRRSGEPFTLRPTELVRSLMISSGGLTDRLARLQRRGLVRRETDPDDRRSSLAILTAEGRELVEAAFRQDMAVENELVAALTPTERECLAALLRKLASALEGV